MIAMMRISFLGLFALAAVGLSALLMARTPIGRRVLFGFAGVGSVVGVLAFLLVAPTGMNGTSNLPSLGKHPLATSTLSDGRELWLHSGTFLNGAGVRWGAYEDRQVIYGEEDTSAMLWFAIRDTATGRWAPFDLSHVEIRDDQGLLFDTIYNTERVSRAGSLFGEELDLTGVLVERYPRTADQFELTLYDRPEHVLGRLTIPIPEEARTGPSAWAQTPSAWSQELGTARVEVLNMSIREEELSIYPRVSERLITGSMRSSSSRNLEQRTVRRETLAIQLRCESEGNPPSSWQVVENELVDSMGNPASDWNQIGPSAVRGDGGSIELIFRGAHRGSRYWRLETEWLRGSEGSFAADERSEPVDIAFPKAGKFEPGEAQWRVGETTVSAVFVAGPSRIQFEGEKMVSVEAVAPGAGTSMSYSSGMGNGEQRDISLGRDMIALSFDPPIAEDQAVTMLSLSDASSAPVELVRAVELWDGVVVFAPNAPFKDATGAIAEGTEQEIAIVVQGPLHAEWVLDMQPLWDAYETSAEKQNAP